MKPSIPKGTRDFTPQECLRREFIFSAIRKVFKFYGFLPIETPAMENLETLTGKYGDEGDRLIFKILNSGDFLSGVPEDLQVRQDAKALTKHIAGKALRYDLTVPFARFVVQNRNQLVFPFKRYQIQPVWRADRPQKGRYREFFQCDADVIGSDAIYCEFELVQIFDRVFDELRIPVQVRINNRKILAGLAEVMGEPSKLIDLSVAMDKLEKTSIDAVVQELKDKGFSDQSIARFKPVLEFDGSASEKLIFLDDLFKDSVSGKNGVEEMKELLDYIAQYELKSAEILLDLSLARGLDYYTGSIFEVIAVNSGYGSLCGGGRYDDLTGIFGLKDMSGVGISFGADRIYDLMLEKNLFPENLEDSAEILLVNFGKTEEKVCIRIINALRDRDIRSELYPDQAKLKKQMSYANDKQIPYVLLVGAEEIQNERYNLKNMKSGEQEAVTINELIEKMQHGQH